MLLFPREHGTYSQLGFPLVAAFAIAGASTAGLLMAAAAIAAFLAHEPALVVLGQRGPRARRELSHAARWWAGCWGLSSAVAGLGVLLSIDPAVRWSIAIPLLPAALLTAAAIRGTEKSWYGEVATALACSGTAVPVSMAAGLPSSRAVALAVPFALLFVSSTLAVRIVILRVRRGGEPRAASLTRRAALALAVGAGLILAFLSATGRIPAAVIVAAAPGLITAAAIAVYPPAPARLRTIGWTLVAISVLTTAIVVTTI
jgi:hypothetical protein